MPVDLSSPIKVNVVSVSEKPNGGAKISIEVSEMSQYPFTVHLNPDQSAMLEGVGEYTALLVPSKLKDGKDGSWQSDYWYNVFSFNGVIDERNQPKPNSQQEKDITDQRYKEPEIKRSVRDAMGGDQPNPQAPANSRPEYGTQSYWINNSVIFKDGVNLEITRQNNSKETKHDHTKVMENIYWNIKHLADIYYGDYKPSSLVEKAEEMGAKVVDIKPTEEPLFEEESDEEWDYRKPSNLKTNADFLTYTQKCGWIQEDVQKWLDNSVPDNWVKNNNKTWLQAAKVCKEKALEQGLEPPYDFRQLKK